MSLFSSKKIDRLLKRETLYQLGEIQYVHHLLDSMFVLSTSTYIKAQKLKQLKANMDQKLSGLPLSEYTSGLHFFAKE